LAATSRSPKLLLCTPMSILNAVVQASQLGLEPGGPLGHAYLVPYEYKRKDGTHLKEGTHLCQFIIGYRGLIELARRSGQILGIEAHVVHRNDKFQVRWGLAPLLEHVPNFDEPGEMVAVYAIGHIREGIAQVEVMTTKQVDAIRARSRAADDGPWVTDYEEMARKTVVKRLTKYLPLSSEFAKAIQVDNEHESGEFSE